MTKVQHPSTGGQVNGEVTSTPDPFDPKLLREEAIADIDVEKVLLTVPVRKPRRTEFFRVHRSDDYVTDTYIFEHDDGMDKQAYLVKADVRHLVKSELKLVRLFTAITRNNDTFLWPVRLPSEGNDRLRRMSSSALLAADRAKELWVKIVWNKSLGAWEMFAAKSDLGEPHWPEKSYRDLIELAFRDNYINRPEHEVIRELVGEL